MDLSQEEDRKKAERDLLDQPQLDKKLNSGSDQS